MREAGAHSVYTIPAGVPFARALAAQILKDYKGSPEALPLMRILLPTRRAARVLREAFLRESGGKPLLLPQMSALGDIEEDELSLHMLGAGMEEVLDLKPALPALKRQLLLARLVRQMREDFSPDQAVALAGNLGAFIDHVHTENLDLNGLHALVPDRLAAHWQVTLDFLKILSEHWPKILEEEGAVDAAARRNRLILALNDYWEKHPPDFPVIAAGSTGSIPATAKLLSVVAGLPKGRVVLPGLDTGMDAESWDCIAESHPQAGLKHLLEVMDVPREAVQPWPFEKKCGGEQRRVLATEIMRPAATSSAWQDLAGKDFGGALENLGFIECAGPQEEALVVAALMREALEEEGRTAVLVTPDRQLARRVSAAAQRWGIALDDSAGAGLHQASIGQFADLFLKACLSDFAPVAVLALLKHPLMRLGLERRVLEEGTAELDIALRGYKPPAGFAGLKGRLGEKDENALAVLGAFEKTALIFLKEASSCDFTQILKAHLAALESLAGAETLWAGESGEAASQFFAETLQHGHIVQDLNLKNYAALMQQLMKAVTVRPAYGTHPRLQILGQLEARLVDADLVIMGGLNEGIWPPAPGFDPWMSRPMRKDFGLPAPERAVGLAAHDFVQGFCAPHVVMTRSIRSDGTPTIPARWLQRLETVLHAAGQDIKTLYRDGALGWVRLADHADAVEPIKRPAPAPPVPLRPAALPVTKIENWMKDPYSIYARYILGLKKLDPLERPVDHALRGEILHKILQRFVSQRQNDDFSGNRDEVKRNLHDIAKTVLDAPEIDPALWIFWWPRFARIADWILEYEAVWRSRFTPVSNEARGEISIDGFSLSARADRIDAGDGGAGIIDYKSGGSFSKSGILNGKLPQLPLEGLILSRGGFEAAPKKLASLSYWVLTGGGTPGKVVEISDGLEDLIAEAEAGLKALIALFACEETPYDSVPDPENAPRFNDYEHLARIREWGVVGDSDETEAA